jgi:hypothetical protein
MGLRTYALTEVTDLPKAICEPEFWIEQLAARVAREFRN